jgi:hypothetical protein
MNLDTLGVALTLLLALVAQWVKVNNEITRLRGRVEALEAGHDEVRQTLRELVSLVTEIKLMLARNGLDSHEPAPRKTRL